MEHVCQRWWRGARWVVVLGVLQEAPPTVCACLSHDARVEVAKEGVLAMAYLSLHCECGVISYRGRGCRRRELSLRAALVVVRR